MVLGKNPGHTATYMTIIYHVYSMNRKSVQGRDICLLLCSLKPVWPEKWWILTPLQKLPKNVGYLGKIIVANGFKKVAQSQINRLIWSHWLKHKKRLSL